MPLRPCAATGCRELVPSGEYRCARHAVEAASFAERKYDAERSARPWRKWYNSAAWKAKRERLLAAEPLCRMCPADSKRWATVADHVLPHRGDHGLFWFGELQPLCKPCHDIRKQREERRGGR